MTQNGPALSVGLAVRNAEKTVGPCIESILGKDVPDLELVVSDNVSDDGTLGLLQEYARADRRVRLSVNEVNIGSHENMNRVLELSRGTFFRWISSDDWLEPGCLSACVRALEEREDAIGATTYFAIHTREGSTDYEEYAGEFPTSPDPARRFERMLWFFHAGDVTYDPIYGVYRREALERTHRLRPSEQTDWLLCAELSLLGPIIHVSRHLANRTRSFAYLDPPAYRRRLDPVRSDELRSSLRRLNHELLELIRSAELSEDESRRCRRALHRFLAREVERRARSRAARIRRRLRHEQATR